MELAASPAREAGAAKEDHAVPAAVRVCQAGLADILQCCRVSSKHTTSRSKTKLTILFIPECRCGSRTGPGVLGEPVDSVP